MPETFYKFVSVDVIGSPQLLCCHSEYLYLAYAKGMLYWVTPSISWVVRGRTSDPNLSLVHEAASVRISYN